MKLEKIKPGAGFVRSHATIPKNFRVCFGPHETKHYFHYSYVFKAAISTITNCEVFITAL